MSTNDTFLLGGSTPVRRLGYGAMRITAPYGAGTVVATKAGLARTGPGNWVPLGRPEHLLQQAYASLRRLGATPCQVAQAWLLRRSPVMLPIPGTSSLAHLRENAGAWDVTLSDEEFAALSRLGR